MAERRRQSSDGRVADQRWQPGSSAAEAALLAGQQWQSGGGSGSFAEMWHWRHSGGGDGGWGGGDYLLEKLSK
jgi:hypothetical protein